MKSLFSLLFISFVFFNGEAQEHPWSKLDSIHINFFERTSTIQLDNCQKLDEELEKMNSFKIMVKDSFLIQNFQLDKKRMEKIEENMHFDASIWNYKNSKIEKFCVSLSNSSMVADDENNRYQHSKNYFIGLLNHYLYIKTQEGEYECFSPECSPITNNNYIFTNMIRIYLD